MAFTYTGDLATSLDRVRFYLRDVTENSGPRPSDGNFSDAELTGLVTAEGSWQRAVAAGFETLAAEWRKFPTFKTTGMTLNRTDIADGYAAQAATWRKRYGSSGSSVSYKAPTRVDGYSDDVDSHEV